MCAGAADSLALSRRKGDAAMMDRAIIEAKGAGIAGPVLKNAQGELKKLKAAEALAAARKGVDVKVAISSLIIFYLWKPWAGGDTGPGHRSSRGCGGG